MTKQNGSSPLILLVIIGVVVAGVFGFQWYTINMNTQTQMPSTLEKELETQPLITTQNQQTSSQSDNATLESELESSTVGDLEKDFQDIDASVQAL